MYLNIHTSTECYVEFGDMYTIMCSPVTIEKISQAITLLCEVNKDVSTFHPYSVEVRSALTKAVCLAAEASDYLTGHHE